MKKLTHIGCNISQQQNEKGEMEMVENWYAVFTEDTKLGKAQTQVQLEPAIAEKIQKLVALD